MDNRGDSATSCDATKPSDEAGLRFREPVFPVPVVPMRIEDCSPTDGAKELLKKIRPEWPTDRLRFTVDLLRAICQSAQFANCTKQLRNRTCAVFQISDLHVT